MPDWYYLLLISVKDESLGWESSEIIFFEKICSVSLNIFFCFHSKIERRFDRKIIEHSEKPARVELVIYYQKFWSKMSLWVTF